MHKHALISVVLPTRNRVDLVARAIDSVLGQTFEEWEFIIVDDGSTDRTFAVLTEYAARDSRIRLHRFTTAVGAATARNQGIRLGRADYLAFVDDDGEWLPRKLERQLEALSAASDEVGVVYSPTFYVDSDGRERVIGSDEADGDARAALLRRNFIDTSAVLVRSSVLRRVGGFDEHLPRLQDWDLWVRLAAITAFRFIPEPLVRTYFTPGSISTRRDALLRAVSILATKLEARADVGRHGRADWYGALGHELVLHGLALEGRRLLWQSLRLRPWSSKTVAKFVLARAGHRPYARAVRLWEAAVRPAMSCGYMRYERASR